MQIVGVICALMVSLTGTGNNILVKNLRMILLQFEAHLMHSLMI